MATDAKTRFREALNEAGLKLDDRDVIAALPVFINLEQACKTLKAAEKDRHERS